jgi:hypothetical protein
MKLPLGRKGFLRATSRLHAPYPSLKHAHKTHYRIVFEEKGSTIDLDPEPPGCHDNSDGTVTGAFSFNNTVYPV